MAKSGGFNVVPSFGFLDFWCTTPIAQITLPAVAADIALPDVVVTSLPAGITIIKADAMFKFGERNNSAVAANKLNGIQTIQIAKGTGAYADCIAWADDQLWTDASSLGPGDIRVSPDMSAVVDGSGTYHFQWHNALVDAASLLLDDVDTGIRIYFSRG